MKVTKYEHACLVIEEGDQQLIIDPGFYTRPMTDTKNVKAIVLTHMHDDHCFEEQIDRILKDNPEAKIFGTDEVVKRIAPRAATAVHHGDYYQEGNFTIEFIGDMHAEIHRSIPLIQNCGVMINDYLYYPGDSFTRPDRKVELLACPSSAPWAKISEMMDFVDEVKPKRVFPTHNIHLSELGHDMYNGRIKGVAANHGGEFFFLKPGETQEF